MMLLCYSAYEQTGITLRRSQKRSIPRSLALRLRSQSLRTLKSWRHFQMPSCTLTGKLDFRKDLKAIQRSFR